MFRRSRVRRAVILAPLITALVGGTLLVSSAQADQGSGSDAAEQPVVTVTVIDDDLGLPVPSSPGDPTYVNWGMQKTGDGPAKDVVITMDLTGISDFATTERDCPGNICTFTPGDISDPDNAGGILPLNAKPGAQLGSSGEVRISGTSSNGTVVGPTVKVTAGRADLVVNEPTDQAGVQPGTTVRERITVGNTGSLAADGMELRLRSTAGLDYAQHFSNCVYERTDEANYHLVNQAVCQLDGKVEPGQSYRLSAPVGLDVTDRALNELFDYRATPGKSTGSSGDTTSGDAKSGDTKGPKLTLVPDGTAPEPGESQAMQVIDVDNTADLVAKGDTATGKPGETVNLTASVRSDGPATVDVNQSDDQLGVMVHIPKGAKAVTLPDDCSWFDEGPAGPVPGKPTYVCTIDPPFASGDEKHLTFGLKIKANATGVSKGQVRATTVYDSGLSFDDNPANDTAPLTLKVR